MSIQKCDLFANCQKVSILILIFKRNRVQWLSIVPVPLQRSFVHCCHVQAIIVTEPSHV